MDWSFHTLEAFGGSERAADAEKQVLAPPVHLMLPVVVPGELTHLHSLFNLVWELASFLKTPWSFSTAEVVLVIFCKPAEGTRASRM